MLLPSVPTVAKCQRASLLPGRKVCATMPKHAAATLVRVQLDLPEDVIEHYEGLATPTRPVEQVVADRLRTCSGHTAQRGLYLDDSNRAEVERLLGGQMFKDADALVKSLRTAYSMKIGGAEIVLPEQIYMFIQSRARENNQEMEAVILDICTRALETFVYGG